jgi:hypothetical protein
MRFKISFARLQFLLFLDIWIKSYGEIKILRKVSARRASVGANQHEWTTSVQKGRQHEEGLRKTL